MTGNPDEAASTLHPEDAALVRAIFERARKLTVETLRSGHAHAGVGLGASATVDAQRALDEIIAETPKRFLPVCQPGCAWCCIGVRVDVSAAEALFIAAAIAKGVFGDPAPIRAKLHAHADDVRGLGTIRYAERKLPCPLLDTPTGTCSIYAYRPIPCRGFNSFDAKRCQRACEHPELDDDSVPLNGPIKHTCDATSVGLDQGIRDAGLASGGLELSSALTIALDREDAEAAWLAGEDVFAAARITSHEEDAEAVRRTQRGIEETARQAARFHVPTREERPLSKNERKRLRRERAKGKKESR